MKIEFPFGGFGGGKRGPGPEADTPLRHDGLPPQLDDPRRVTRTGFIAAGAFAALLLIFAAFAPLSEAALAEGEVVTSGDSILIQPAAAGVVNGLLVTEGQRVAAGQPLIRLNGVKSGAAAEQAQAKRDALRALQARLLAERNGSEQIIWPADLARRSDNRNVASAMTSQRAIFETHSNVMEADRRIVEQQRGAATAQQISAREQLRLINDELAGVRELYRKGFARKTTLRALERAAAQLTAEGAVTSGEVEKAALQSARLANDQMMQTVAQLGSVEEQLAQVDPALRVRNYDAARDLLRSPVAGRVSGVTRIGEGSVLRAGQQVMTIVPDARALIVEAWVKPTDIDDVSVGMPATLRLTSVNPHGRTDFEGKVIALSPSPIAGTDGQPRFRAQIVVADPDQLRREGVSLRPGIPVSVQIRSADRTLFDYLFGPLTDAFGNMFREE